MTADQALSIIDRFLDSEKISNLQEIIFRQAWENKTYQEIASSSDYTDDYIRDNGAKLWQLLSTIFDEKINKSNFKSALERYYRQQKTATFNDNQDWEEAIDVSFFYGRTQELATLQQWTVKDRCRLLGVFGVGGIGKTSLAAKLAQQTASEFDFIIWRSLYNAPPLDRLLAGIIEFLSQQEIEQSLAQTTTGKISQLIDYLHSHRVLLILDNAKTILQSGTTCGHYRAGYEEYREFFKHVGEISHQSCVLLTSREKPLEFITLEGDKLLVRSLELKGLEAEICKEICQLKGQLFGSKQDWQTLCDRYSGNPLLLKTVATTIKDLFDGDVQQFLQQEIIFFDDLEDILREQLDRLSSSEQEVMSWLAIEQESTSFKQLQQNLLLSIPPRKLLSAIKSLQRRSLIEKSITGFKQQPVVKEYLIEQQSEKLTQVISI